MATQRPADHPIIPPPKVGVLLLNLGTPDATDYWSVRRYLSEFLSDRRVIETNPLVWQPILQGIILSVRPQKSGANYDRIWDKEANDSPLRVITRRQAEKLQARLGEGVVVDFAMRYGNPSTPSRLEALQEAGCTRILLVPLYPQYSATTTATANDKAFEALRPDALAAGDPHACRPISTSRPISRRWRAASPKASRRSISSRTWCSPPTTACPRPTSWPATPTTASA